MTPSSTARNTTTMSTTRTEPQRKSLWIPGLFIGLMLLVVAVNGTMMYLAEHTFSGLDTEKAYLEGIEYNAILKNAAASAALGRTAKAEFVDIAGGRHLAVRIADKAGKPVGGLMLTVHLVRPISTAFDQLLTLQPSSTEPGLYGADVQLPAAGIWELRISASGGTTPWQTTERVFVK